LRLQHNDNRADRWRILRTGDRALILEDEGGSSREDGEIAHAGDDAATPSWECERP
jgi:hypothetical protein